MRANALIVLLLSAMAATTNASPLQIGGHTKFNLDAQRYPSGSLLRESLGVAAYEAQADLRLNIEWRRAGWSMDANYQLIAVRDEKLDAAANLPATAAPFIDTLPDDPSRLFDLTRVLERSGDQTLLHRLDRLWVGYSSDKTVVRFGRQALSWGNGQFYAPMDLVNPFDPATIDSEYKPGDDMLYTQYLYANGADMQGAVVFRRDPESNNVEARQATTALKYHGFANAFEYDLLVARNYDDPVLGLGVSRSIGGAVWGSDLVVTRNNSDTTVQAVTNLSYSWTLGGKNASGVVEYHYNGFGQSDDRYAPTRLASNPELLARIARGQSFTLGRHYVAGSVMVEMTPLWTLTPVLLANVGDPSGLLQLTTSLSLADSMTLLGSVNIPLGPSGSEFGGIESGIAGQDLATGVGVFAQFAWYF